MKVVEHDSPWKHFELFDMFPRDRITAARATVPIAGDYRYDNDCERRKETTELRESLSDDCNYLLDRLTSREIVARLSEILGIELTPDFSRRCAGIQAMYPGGHLGVHLDAALHPGGLERRANLILYLDNLHYKSGGGLQLCDPGGSVIKTLYPKAGDAVLWPCSDISYHGVQKLASDGPMRYSVAAFYLGERRPTATRERALFIPNRGA